MTELLDTLARFNRKERFHLFTAATGEPGRMLLSSDFRAKLGSVADVSIPERALGFVDYHLDWIHAATFLEREGAPVGSVQPNREDGGGEPVATGSQEDVDLLVAWQSGEITHLVMVEAKGDTAWTNKQLGSKERRLRALFGESGQRVPRVHPSFVLMSPRKSEKLVIDGWPAWMKGKNGQERWLRLDMDEGLHRVYGCDVDGRPSEARQFWTSRPIRKRGA